MVTVWSATLVVKDLGGNSGYGCSNESAVRSVRCSTTATLSDDDLSHGGNYAIVAIVSTAGKLAVTFDKEIPVGLYGATLNVGSASYHNSLSENKTITWSDASLTQLTLGNSVSLSLDASPPPSPLTGLSLSAGGSSVTLSPAFAADTVVYTATVPEGTTNVSVTPTWDASVSKADVSSSTPDWSDTITSTINLNSSGDSATVDLAFTGPTWVSVTAEGTGLALYNLVYRIVITKPVLDVDASPACDATVTDMSVTPSRVLVLTPAPSELAPAPVENVEVEYRVIAATYSEWLDAEPIEPGGRSIRTSLGTFAQLRQAFPGFAGFRYRLKTDTGVRKDCTWQFDDDGGGPPPPPPDPPPPDPPPANPPPGGGGPTQSSDASLSDLEISAGTLEFESGTTRYPVTVAHAVESVTVTPTVNHAAATVRVNGVAVESGTASGPIALSVGENAVEVVVTAENGTTRRYLVTVTVTATVRLAALPNPVTEGATVTVTATLSSALGSSVTIPVTVTRDTSEVGDHGTLASIMIGAGTTSGTGTITTTQDTDVDDEEFTVALGTLPSGVTAGSPNSVQITIKDDTPIPTVSLSASPNPVDEGTDVMVTATLSTVLTSAVTIPLTVTQNTSESGDHGTLASIAIGAGTTSGTGTITTTQDTDVDDEEFTVALGTLPSGVTAGSPNSVQITIKDDDDTPPGGGGPTQSSDASLSGLEISAGTLEFESGTTSYAVTVAYEVEGVTVTPTVNDAAATVTVNGTAVASGTASGTIALNVGDTAVEVEVTAEDGTPRTYRVTVTREPEPPPEPPAQSSDATLSALTATSSTSADGTYSDLGLKPAFSAATTAYTATVPHATTHMKLTPTVNDTAATVTVNGVAVESGTASGSIALSVGENLVEVVVTAEDGTTRTYRVTVTRGVKILGAAEKAHVDKVGKALLGQE